MILVFALAFAAAKPLDFITSPTVYSSNLHSYYPSYYQPQIAAYHPLTYASPYAYSTYDYRFPTYLNHY